MPEKSPEQFIREVAGAEEEEKSKKPEEAKSEEAKPKKISPELKALLEQAEEFLESYRSLFITFAKDVSLTFEPRLDIETFKIDLERGRVLLRTQWFQEQGYSMDQIIWACFHELSHFADLKSDPEGMLKNFDYIKAKGREARAYHTFYNVFDDIFVNRKVASRAPTYSPDTPTGQEVKRLYQEKLFKGADYTEYPRHLQYLYAMLREVMVPEEEVIVSDEVKEAMEQPIKILGQEFSPQKFLDTFIKPTASMLKKEENPPHRRYELLQKYLEPIFAELLKRDQGDPRFQKSPKPKKGEGEGDPEKGEGTPFDDYYDEFDKNNPDQIKPEDLKDWINDEKKKGDEEAARKKKEDEEAKKSPGQKTREAQAAADAEFAKRHDIPEPVMREFRKIEARVAPYLDELSNLWRSIVYGKSEETRVALEGFYKAGIDIAIPQVVREWPKIEMGKLEETRIYIKPVEKIIMRERPELIRVHLVCDLSGSMDEAKRGVLAQTAVLLLRSLEEFQTYLNMTRSLTKSKLNVDTEMWGFGDGAERLKHFAGERAGALAEADRAELIKSIDKLSKDKGDTYDDRALRPIAEEIESRPGWSEAVKKEKIMEIIIEITDGGSSDEDASRAALRLLEEAGSGKVIARAIQIGIVSDDEKAIFQNVWGERGNPIGDKIENLPRAVSTILAKYLGTVKL